MGKLLLVSTLLALMAVTACETTSGRARMEADLASAPGDIERGRILYERSCSRCHALRMPASHSKEEWRFFVRKYGRRARLSRPRQGLVYAYLRHRLTEGG